MGCEYGVQTAQRSCSGDQILEQLDEAATDYSRTAGQIQEDYGGIVVEVCRQPKTSGCAADEGKGDRGQDGAAESTSYNAAANVPALQTGIHDEVEDN